MGPSTIGVTKYRATVASLKTYKTEYMLVPVQSSTTADIFTTFDKVIYQMDLSCASICLPTCNIIN